MKLNDATLLSKTIDGVECSTMREFVSKLVKAKNLSMQVYVNARLVCSGAATLRSDNHWIIASVNSQMSLTDSVPVEAVVARVMQGETILFESITLSQCDTIIPSSDTMTSFHMCLVNDSPYNELTKRVPDSKFLPRLTSKLTQVDFDDLPRINGDDDITVETPDDGGDDHQPDVLATTGTFSAQITGSTDLVARPLWLDDETFSQGSELQIAQNVSHTLMIPLLNMSAEISISDVDGLCLDGDIQYVDPLPDDQQRPDVVKNALVTFTMSVDYVLLSVNVWIAEAP